MRKQAARSLSVKGGASSTTAPTTKQICTKCGKQKYDKGARCPARDTICHKCNCKGHNSSQCFSKIVATVNANELNLETALLGTMRANPGWLWTTKLLLLLLSQVEISFKLMREQKLLLSQKGFTRDWAYPSHNSGQRSRSVQLDRHSSTISSQPKWSTRTTPLTNQYLLYVDCRPTC